MTYKTKIKLSDATDGMRVQFVNHYHQIIDKEIDCTHMIGTVTKHDHGMIEGGSYDGQSHFEIQVKLEDCRIYSKGELDDWDQTLIFHYPHDEDYKNVGCEIINDSKLIFESAELSAEEYLTEVIEFIIAGLKK